MRASRQQGVKTYHHPLAGEVSNGLVRGSGHFDGLIWLVLGRKYVLLMKKYGS